MYTMQASKQAVYEKKWKGQKMLNKNSITKIEITKFDENYDAIQAM